MSGELAWLEAVEAPPEGDLVVAVSGGPDSAFLAWAMCRHTDPRLVHVDHGTAASGPLADAARRLAEHLGVDLTTIAVDVPNGPSWENQARTVRRGALRAEAGDAPIATGHHRDDLAETVVANLMRGAGATGLAAMAARHEGWLRPLLGMSRSEIRAAVDALGLPHEADPSNDDLAFTRNRIRHEVLLALEAETPGIAPRLARTAELLAADDAELNRRAASLHIADRGSFVELSAFELRCVRTPVAGRAVRQAIRLVDGTYPGSASDVAAVLEVARGVLTRATIGGGIVVDIEHGIVALHRSPTASLSWEPVELPVPGSAQVAGRRISATRTGRLPIGRRRVRLAAEAVGDAVCIRPVVEGDRIDIGGASKLASDALREASIPVRSRAAWPAVDAGGRIAWLVGVRAAAWCRASTGDDAVTFETGAI